MDRHALLREANQAAVNAREAIDVDQFGPVDPYAAAAALNVKVVFMGASMEGFYLKGSPSRILLSAARPVARRAFTCAHELGHHWFGHGSTIDQLHDDDRPESHKPDEVLANGFAAFFLMPTLGLRRAFNTRGWSINAPTPLQLYTVACDFGVGYQTLLYHLSYALREISAAHRVDLDKWTPQRIRRDLLPEDFDGLLVIDAHSRASTFDVEEGTAVLLPQGLSVTGRALTVVEATMGDQALYRATRQGEAVVSGLADPFHIRVMRKAFEGAAAYRFLEDPDEPA
jgi:IrrE N-terminal-like domain